MMDASEFMKLSVAELSHYLSEKGIPSTFCKVFEGRAKEGYVYVASFILVLYFHFCQKTLLMDEHFSGFRRST